MKCITTDSAIPIIRPAVITCLAILSNFLLPMPAVATAVSPDSIPAASVISPISLQTASFADSPDLNTPAAIPATAATIPVNSEIAMHPATGIPIAATEYTTNTGAAKNEIPADAPSSKFSPELPIQADARVTLQHAPSPKSAPEAYSELSPANDDRQTELRAGVAATVITNRTSRVMVNGRMSEGVHSDIQSRALVLNDGGHRLVIVTSDLNCHDVITPHLRARAQDELGLEPSQLILLATHNHNAPIQINPDNFDYGRRVADDLFDLIGEAMENERGPVTLQTGQGQGYFLTSVGNAPTDYEVQVLRVMQGDHPMAILFSQGTHPVQSTRNRIDTGHPGYAMDRIEEALPGVQAMYAAASGGNQFPYNRREISELIQEQDTKGIEYVDSRLEMKARDLGHRLADVVLDIVSRDMTDVTGPLASRMEILSLPLADPIPEEEARRLAENFPEDVGFVSYPHEHRGTNWVRMLLRYYEKGLPFPTRTTDMISTDDTYLIHKEDTELLETYDYSIHERFPSIYEEVIVATIGSMPFVAMQGEVTAPIGARIKDTFRTRGPIMVFAYMGEHNLYIPTRELVRLDVYQPRTLQIQYASPVGWDPSVEDVMVSGVVDLIRTSLDAATE